MRHSLPVRLAWLIILFSAWSLGESQALDNNPAGQAAQFKVGRATVWALADSQGDADLSIFTQAGPEALKKYAPDGQAPAAIMAFAIQHEAQVILIDTGLGSGAGGRAGKLTAALGRAGLTPEAVTLVLLTHMHFDHIGGLVDEKRVDGQVRKVFPFAQVLVNRLERDFWLSEEAARKYPQNEVNFALARQVFDLYGPDSRVRVFEAGQAVAPGLQALEAGGHTPGHTAFLLESEGRKLLFWGDLIHAAAIQFPRPDLSPVYDLDPEQAAATRKRYLEKTALEKLPVAGAHLPFPAVGQVERTASGEGYVFKPGL